MNENIRAYLDGERELDSLGPDDRREAAMWARALEELRDSELAPAPAWLEDSIMTEVESEAERSRTHWLRRPMTLRVTPLHGLLAAAAVAAITLFARPPEGTGPAPAEATVYVQFLLEAPGARSVAVAGDFDQWEGSHTLTDPDGDGVWTGRVPLRPGLHQYMFVIDGADWITDPNAQHYADDGFGGRNAVIAVESPLAETRS